MYGPSEEQWRNSAASARTACGPDLIPSLSRRSEVAANPHACRPAVLALQRRSFSDSFPHRAGATSVRRRSGGRPESDTFGDCLTVPAPPRVVRATANNQLGNRVLAASVAKRRRRGTDRLRCRFRTDAPAWPDCAAGLTWPRRGASVVRIIGTARRRA